MAILATIKDSFKNGWERSGKSKSPEDEYPGNYKYTGAYQKNITRASFTTVSDDTERQELGRITSSPMEYHKDDKIRYENNFKIQKNILQEISKNYQFVYNKEAEILGDWGVFDPGEGKAPTENDIHISYISMPVVPSLFNPLYGINIIGITGNTPLQNDGGPAGNSQTANTGFYAGYNNMYDEDVSDCSISTLVDLSNNGEMGQAIYKYADFMYCKNLGKISNNRLITLRRFPLPIGDNIWDIGSYKEGGKYVEPESGVPGGSIIPPDTGRLITWLDDNNKLEDILKFEYHETWQERKGEFQDVHSKEDDNKRGILGSIINLANPKYRSSIGVGVGTGVSGAGNLILDKFAGSVFNGKLLSASGTMSGDAEGTLERYDRNRIYEPKGTVRKTHLYEGELEFNHSFTLVFDYELRAYENINPRSAFLDLMNNIFHVTYRTGKFWGGAVWFMGAPGNKKGWETAEALISGSFIKLEDTFSALLNGEFNIGDLLGQAANYIAEAAKNTLETGVKIGKDLLTPGNNDTKQGIKETIANTVNKYNVTGMIQGMLRNRLGRPALYATNSILTGDPVGLWHVTIGNPRNPIASMGNMIIENTSFQQYGPLGIDDFPTGIKVSVTLKHAKPRDMIEIGKMYTQGRIGLAVPLGKTPMDKMVKNGKGKTPPKTTNKTKPTPVQSPKIKIRGERMRIPEKVYKVAWASTSPSVTYGKAVTDKK